MIKVHQKLYEWRGSFGSAALATIQDFWDDPFELKYASADDPDWEWENPYEDSRERQAFIEEKLGPGLPFRWGFYEYLEEGGHKKVVRT